ncbi:hypothetical protein [Sinorhizobium psoraleae]|uniref:hypothetical protein n=1 Tax=Sinorhizobium psoraleae TaxID=520838 RepID=UPI00156A3921|nr:hypothetical protein [Sinorhizobium psoraleae]
MRAKVHPGESSSSRFSDKARGLGFIDSRNGQTEGRINRLKTGKLAVRPGQR